MTVSLELSPVGNARMSRASKSGILETDGVRERVRNGVPQCAIRICRLAAAAMAMAMACESGSTVDSRGSGIGGRGSWVGRGRLQIDQSRCPRPSEASQHTTRCWPSGNRVATSTREKPDAKNPRSSQGAAQLVGCVSFGAECPNCLRAFRKVYRRITVNRSGGTRTVPLGIRRTPEVKGEQDQASSRCPSSAAVMSAKAGQHTRAGIRPGPSPPSRNRKATEATESAEWTVCAQW